ncbi:lasso peptide isopeptide bond-forming cyclase [Echinicola sediminis]
MSVIYGSTGDVVRLSEQEEVLSHWKADRIGEFNSNHFSGAVLELFNVPESPASPNPYIHKNHVVFADCRIDNRDELAKQLSIENQSGYSDTAFIAFAYEKWGSNAPKHLIGDFAFVVYDTQSHEVFAARDHFGVRPFYYSIINGELVFASEQKGILTAENCDRELNDAHIVSLFSYLELPFTDGLYKSVKALAPGCSMTWEKGQLNLQEYWNIYKEKVKIPPTREEQEAEFNRLVRRSVKDRLRSYKKVGAELSGGLDSSGIVSLAMEELGKGKEFYTYSHGKPEKSTNLYDKKDDSQIVKEVCQKHDIAKWLRVVNEEDVNVEELIQLMLTVYDEYSENNVPLICSSYLKYTQSDGVGTILSGWGGDQAVTHQLTGFVNSYAYQRKYIKLWKSLQKQDKSPFRQFLSFIYQLIRNRPKKINAKQLHEHKRILDYGLLQERWISEFNLRQVPFPLFFRLHTDTLKERLIREFIRFSTYKRTVDHVIIGKHFKVDYRFPLIDVRLVSYVINLPLETFAPSGEYRYLFSKLVKPLLPSSVINNLQSRVPTTPYYYRLYEDNKYMLRKKLNAKKESETLRKYFNMDTMENKISYLEIGKKLETYMKLIYLATKH